MGKPITTMDGGVCFAFPDVCLTPSPGGDVPVPYPNIGILYAANMENKTVDVKAVGNWVVRKDSFIKSSMGDEAGTKKGVTSGTIQDKVEFVTASSSVFVNGQGVVRMFDTTSQNAGNAVGVVLSGVPTVLIGD